MVNIIVERQSIFFYILNWCLVSICLFECIFVLQNNIVFKIAAFAFFYYSFFICILSTLFSMNKTLLSLHAYFTNHFEDRNIQPEGQTSSLLWRRPINRLWLVSYRIVQLLSLYIFPFSFYFDKIFNKTRRICL